MIDDVLLGSFAVAALGGAALMLVLRHPMHVALALVATMLSLAGVYAMLGAHAIAIFQVLIMLLDMREASLANRYSWMLVPGVIACLLGAVVLARGLWQSLAPAGPAKALGVQPFAIAFVNDYWLHFELVSVLLVAAVVAALAVIEVGRRKHG